MITSVSPTKLKLSDTSALVSHVYVTIMPSTMRDAVQFLKIGRVTQTRGEAHLSLVLGLSLLKSEISVM